METSIFAFATDLRDEGIEVVLDNVERRAGLRGISPAFVYHAARDVLPHNPARKLQYFDAGAAYFRPDPSAYDGLRIQPRVSALAREGDVLADLCAAAEARDLRVHAWTVFLHADRVPPEPECSPANAFGDRLLTDLCPAHPDVRAYVGALASDVGRHPVESIVAESLHFHGLEHGYHHERYMTTLGPRARFLLGLCFCDHCRAAAVRKGVDAEGVQRAVRTELEDTLAGSQPQPGGEVRRDAIESLAGGEMAGYIEARCETVTSLVAEASEAAVARGRRLSFLDLSGGAKGYATGQPAGDPAAATSWQFGIDLGRLARVCDEIQAVGYAQDPDRLALDLRAYREAVGSRCALSVALRPSAPDTRSVDNLRRKVRLAREAGLARIDFYHYGLVESRALDWIREAMSP
jgi:hypothetical protein